MMTLKTQAGPDDQSGRVRTSLSVRGQDLFSAFFDFKRLKKKNSTQC
jgi:hypothetical protein